MRRLLRKSLGGSSFFLSFLARRLSLKSFYTNYRADSNRYASIVSSQKRTEDSLRWFKKGRQGTLSFFGRGNSVQSPDDGSTEDDKVKMQMQLDIDQLGKEALTVGVDVGKMGAWEALRNATEDQGKEEK